MPTTSRASQTFLFSSQRQAYAFSTAQCFPNSIWQASYCTANHFFPWFKLQSCENQSLFFVLISGQPNQPLHTYVCTLLLSFSLLSQSMFNFHAVITSPVCPAHPSDGLQGALRQKEPFFNCRKRMLINECHHFNFKAKFCEIAANRIIIQLKTRPS